MGLTALVLAVILVGPTRAQQQAAPAAAPPPFATTKVEGTDNVYIFRYQGHQSMFVVTKDGVIATDPIGLRRPAAKTYIEEIRKITKAPIKYVIYSHSHYDHIAGGKPFKDLGANFIAHKNAKARILELKPADVVVPDEVVDKKKVIKLGGTTLELLYVGRNHSDSTLVMRLPKEKIIFTVDWIPLQAVQFRAMADTYIPRHRGRLEKGARDGLGQADCRSSGAGRPPDRHQRGRQERAGLSAGPLGGGEEGGGRGKNYADAQKDIKLPKYESYGGYGPFLPMNIERYYDFHNRGI